MNNVKFEIGFNAKYRKRLNKGIDCVEHNTYNSVSNVIFSVVWLRTLPLYREVVEKIKKQIE